MSNNSLEIEIAQFARRLCRRYAEERREDPSAFKRRAVKLLRSCLPPFPGRQPSKEIDKIAALLAGGMRLSDALAKVKPAFRSWNWRHRKQTLDSARDALRKRRKRCGPNGRCSSSADKLCSDVPGAPPAESDQVN